MSGLLNKAKEATGGQSTNNASNNPGTATGGQNEDYGDKGLDAVEHKEGISLDRSTNERITDGAREGFESETGKDVPSKFSN